MIVCETIYKRLQITASLMSSIKDIEFEYILPLSVILVTARWLRVTGVFPCS